MCSVLQSILCERAAYKITPAITDPVSRAFLPSKKKKEAACIRRSCYLPDLKKIVQICPSKVTLPCLSQPIQTQTSQVRYQSRGAQDRQVRQMERVKQPLAYPVIPHWRSQRVLSLRRYPRPMRIPRQVQRLTPLY